MRQSTGIPGLDHILRGGFLPSRVYLVYGEAGSGKTTFGLHFLAAGRGAGERGLLISFGQPEAHVRRDAKAVGLGIDDVPILDLGPRPETFSEQHTYDIFTPAEVERDPLSVEISRSIQRIRPQRIFVDSFEDFRQLAPDPFHHRRLVQSFFRFATDGGATLVVACTEAESARDADGLIRLDFSLEGRGLRVIKFRGSGFHAGHHPVLLTDTGLQVPFSAA